MLTTTLDGLWVLQVLSGIEVLAPELGLRPHLPSVETSQMALGHPAAQDLHAAAVIDRAGVIDQTVVEWLTVLSRRDMALLVHVQTPAGSERIMLARFAQWWVSLERCGDRVRLSGAGTASGEQSAGQLISAHIERWCGQMPPAAMKPVTIRADELLGAARDTGDLQACLAAHGVDRDQAALLALAAAGDRSAQASMVAIQSGVTGGPACRHIGSGTVTVIDTPRGRLVSEQVSRGGMSWLIVSPGSAGHLASAVLTMMRDMPAHHDWSSYRKVV